MHEARFPLQGTQCRVNFRFFTVLTGITAGSEARMVVVVEAWRLGLTQRLPENSTWLLNLKGIIALPTARNINEAAWAQ